MPAPLGSAVLACFLATGVAAQTYLVETHKQHLPAPADPVRCSFVGWPGDLDGDGDIDLVVPDVGATRTLLNDGNGVFRELPRLVGARYGGGGLLDADRDGDLDAVIGGTLLQNDGRGRLTHWKSVAPQPSTLALGDVDRDGDVDLITVSSMLGGEIWLNDGRANFKKAPAGSLPALPGYANALQLADCDADGDPDLLLTVSDVAGPAPPHLYLNNGRGRFTDVTATHLPATKLLGANPRAFDADGDRDLDLWLSVARGNDQLYLNDGRARFTNAPVGSLPKTNGAGFVTAFDADGDGDRDVAIGGNFAANALYLNDGRGRFRAASAAFPGGGNVGVLAAFDADRDGDLDVIGNGLRCDVLGINDGRGKFLISSPVVVPLVAVGDLIAADLDGDALPEVIASQSGIRILVHEHGVYRDDTSARMPKTAGWSPALRTGDADRDGDLDLFAILAGRVAQFRNNGRGVFAAAPMPGVTNAAALELGDLDSDGDLDAIGAGARGMFVLAGDGRGGFRDVSSTALPVLPIAGQAVAIGDFDGDRDLDVVFAGMGYVAVLFNERAVFTVGPVARMPFSGAGVAYARVADADVDGDLDLLVSGHLFTNNGRGSFRDVTATAIPNAPRNSWDASVGDFDDDGDVDLAFVDWTRTLVLYEAVRPGVFRDVSARLSRRELGTGKLVFQDLDDDGDHDLLAVPGGGRGGLQLLHWSTVRQLRTPWIARPGYPFALELLGRPGFAARAQVGITVLGASAKRTQLPPLGTLGIDPAGAIALPAVAMPASRGSARIAFPLPNAASLKGRSIYAQALIGAAGSGFHFTNTTRDVMW